jgi:Family of unknown function (DUF5343)
VEKAPYTPNPAAIPRFLAVIQTTGQPDKVDGKYLRSVGFKSGNDNYLPGVFKTIGFLDPQGKPTDMWSAYRDKDRGKGVLASAIRRGYSELFKTYPDAYRKDNEALRNFFTIHNEKLGESTLALVVATFKRLCDNADFDRSADDGGAPAPAAPHVVPPVVVTPPTVTTGRFGEPSVNINIELHLPPTEDASIYEKLFAALRKHLLS